MNPKILLVVCVLNVVAEVHLLHTAHSNKGSWHNLWTTLAPPTTTKLYRRRNILDSIRAVTDALKRVTENRYHQRIVSTFPSSRMGQILPTKETVQGSSTSAGRGQLGGQQTTVHDQAPSSNTWVNPTPETRFERGRSSFGLVSSNRGAISQDFGVQSHTNPRQHAKNRVSGLGLFDEAGMLETKSNEPRNYNAFVLNNRPVAEPVAIYALDSHHSHTTTTAQRQEIRPTAKPSSTGTTISQNRYRVMPDGSIVDFGVRVRNDNTNRRHQLYESHRQSASTHWEPQTQPASTAVSPTQESRVRPMTSPIWSPSLPALLPTNQAPPVQTSIGHQQIINARSQPQPTQTAFSSSTIEQTPHSSTAHQQTSSQHTSQAAITAGSSTTFAGSSAPQGQERQPNDRSVGIPIGSMLHVSYDDSSSTTVDDPYRHGNVKTDDGRPVHQSFPVKIPKLPLQSKIYTTSIAGLNITVRPTAMSTRPKLTTTTTKATTTTTQPTTTTTTPTTTTTTPKPTQHPDDVLFYSQGGVPLNITSLHDNHVCPSSRARWQDYTVYLETKPRLCMIQITFHARYKREPIYTNTWWSNTVDYVYKVVYDPEVSFVDRIPPQPIRL